MTEPVIAVVDDDQVLREVLHEALEGEDYRVVTAANTAAAVALLRDEPPAVLILDLRMERPDSGLDVLQALYRSQPAPATAVILCTADIPWLRANAPGLREMGFFLLGKPFNLDDLVALVRLAVGPTAEHVPQADTSEAPATGPAPVPLKEQGNPA